MPSVGITRTNSFVNHGKKVYILCLQFLISATAWYCKLCDTWVGDLHCASQHLKSQNHNQNFANFVEQNPHWELEWLRDRDKALVRISKDRRSDSDDSENGDSWKIKKKDSTGDNRKDKKKKKVKKRKKHSSDSSSSSSSSDSSSENENSDKSKSIRVAMRNKMKLQAQMIMKEDVGSKWEVLGRLVEEQKKKEKEQEKEVADMGKESEPEDSLINQWMTVNEPQEKDKRLFNNLKDRMKQKQEAEKARLAELEQKRLAKEKEERELKEKKDREERELKEREAEKRRQQEELEKQREKEREQIRFKPKEKPKKRSASKSPEKIVKPKSPTPEPKKPRERSPEKPRRDSHHNENGKHSTERKINNSSNDKEKESPNRRSRSSRDKKSISSNKKPHFIGRMPLFKNKKGEEKIEKEIKKEDYDIPRRSRFQPGNLARAFIPEPEVVCFPRLSCIPPLMIPPPPVLVPEPPKISEELKPPPPPIINSDGKEDNEGMDTEDDSLPAPPPPPNVTGDVDSDDDYKDRAFSPSDYEDPMSQLYPEAAAMMQYQYAGMEYNAMMYSQMYDYSQDVAVEGPVPPPDDVPLEHTLPLPPPPLPPDDPNEDLAMLGISADDMAAQMF